MVLVNILKIRFYFCELIIRFTFYSNCFKIDPKSGFQNHFLKNSLEKWFPKPLSQKVVLKTTFSAFFIKWFSKQLFFHRISKVVLKNTFENSLYERLSLIQDIDE